MKEHGTIVVTGGCGYIGSHTIIEIFENTQFDVISIDNYLNSDPTTLDRIEAITGKSVKNFDVDICDFSDTLKKLEAIDKIEGVIHFAALKSVPHSVADPNLYYHNNIESLVNILSVCKKLNINNFIFSSSCSVYGSVDELPVSETTILNEAESPYGRTKQIGEQIIKDFSKVNSTRCIALRYFNPVGAHMSGKIGELQINKPDNLVPVITQTAIGIMDEMTVYGNSFDTRDGTCIRDYVHVSDIARAHVDALNYIIKKNSNEAFEIFNLGTGTGVTVLEAIKEFEKSTNVKLKYVIGDRREGDVSSIYSNSAKAESILGWKPRFGVEDMMKSAWDWQKQLIK